jgi:hypothetical protein
MGLSTKYFSFSESARGGCCGNRSGLAGYQSMNDAEYQMLHPPTATRLSTMDNFLSLSDSWQMIRVFFNESPAIILVHAVVCKNS